MKSINISIKNIVTILMFFSSCLLYATVDSDVISNIAYAQYSVKNQTDIISSNEVNLTVEKSEDIFEYVWIEIISDKSIVGIDDVIKYNIIIHNDSDILVEDLILTNYLPLGLKYQDGSCKLNNQMASDFSLNGKNLSLYIGDIKPNSTTTLSVVAHITTAIKDNKISNSASVSSDKLNGISNIAKVTVYVKEELMRSKGVIVGQVYDKAYKNHKKGHGISKVKLYMEDGSYVITDNQGKYHFEGVTKGRHIIQVDKDILPYGYQVTKCSSSNRFLGRNFSQFIDINGGDLKRVDFCLKRTNQKQILDNYNYSTPTFNLKIPNYNEDSLKNKALSDAIIWPPDGFVPPIPSTSIAISYHKNHKAILFLNNKEVSMLNFEHKITDTNSSRTIDIYKGVDLLNQTNMIKVKIFNKNAQLVKTLLKEIHVSEAPVRADYIEKNSYNIADGIHSPIIAIRFIDENGYPLRSGITGSFSVEYPYVSQESIDNLANNPLGNTSNIKNRYTIDSDGTAYIKLQPTTITGEVILHFKLQNRDEVVRAWLKPKLREWIMVGFVEGSIGYNTIKSNLKSIDSIKAEDRVIKEGRVSFFAKGKIKGNWLLTMAYNSAKKSDNKLFSEIDPNRYYTLYGDSVRQNYEASSRKKLFLKIEKSNFSALYGDFNTDLTYTKLSSYSRKMTGLKGEYHDKNINLKTFASNSQQLFIKDEIIGDGTSGYYNLSNSPVIENSETIKIEVRDRYHNEKIISQRVLTIFKDYEIDYHLGRVYFKEPIFSTDRDFNPSFIIIDYEIDGDDDSYYTYGGRLSLNGFNQNIELGGSYIYEDNAKKQNSLIGIDTTFKISNNTILKMEYAQTNKIDVDIKSKGSAKFLEIDHLSKGLHMRAYYREQDSNFGLGQISSSLGATKKMGLEINKRLKNRINIRANLYRDTDILNSTNQDSMDIKFEIDRTLWNSYIGYRYAKQTDKISVNQLLLGVSKSFFNQKLKLFSTYDYSFDNHNDTIYPTKTTVGLNYAITSSLSLFGNYEWSQKYNLANIGMRYSPWSGMNIENSTISEVHNNQSRVYNTIGVKQSYQVNKQINLNLAYQESKIIDDNYLDINFTKDLEPFKSYSFGINYHTKIYTMLFNAQKRESLEEDKLNLTLALYMQTTDDLAIAFSSEFIRESNKIKEVKDINTKLLFAYRPEDTEFIILDKLEYIHKDSGQKIVNNLNINYMPNNNYELSLQYGFKYVVDTIDDFEYKGITHLIGIDNRFDLNSKFNIGIQGSILYSQKSDNFDYGAGLYLGYNIFDNGLLVLGYNIDGFEDRDFSMQNHRAEGAYLQFRMKFDQDTINDAVKLLSW
jgi:uncharacterized repeat protein (TIGR01451 family)